MFTRFARRTLVAAVAGSGALAGGCRAADAAGREYTPAHTATPAAAAAPAAAASEPRTSVIGQFIDHTILKADAMPVDVMKIVHEAVVYQTASVCVNGMYVSFVRQLLDTLGATNIDVCAVVGFPLGASASTVKAFEAKQAIQDGAREIDMVLPVGMMKAWSNDVPGALEYVVRDIAAVATVCKDHDVKLKVILETCLLTPEERNMAVNLCAVAGADFVKTSTGFSTGGAKVEDVAAMAAEARKLGEIFGTTMEVKASGGIRNFADASKMLTAGATRLGCSATPKIVQEALAMERSMGVHADATLAASAANVAPASAASDTKPASGGY